MARRPGRWFTRRVGRRSHRVHRRPRHIRHATRGGSLLRLRRRSAWMSVCTPSRAEWRILRARPVWSAFGTHSADQMFCIQAGQRHAASAAPTITPIALEWAPMMYSSQRPGWCPHRHHGQGSIVLLAYGVRLRGRGRDWLCADLLDPHYSRAASRCRRLCYVDATVFYSWLVLFVVQSRLVATLTAVTPSNTRCRRCGAGYRHALRLDPGGGHRGGERPRAAVRPAGACVFLLCR